MIILKSAKINPENYYSWDGLYKFNLKLYFNISLIVLKIFLKIFCKGDLFLDNIFSK